MQSKPCHFAAEQQWGQVLQDKIHIELKLQEYIYPRPKLCVRHVSCAGVVS
jgi:hypothetical protein